MRASGRSAAGTVSAPGLQSKGLHVTGESGRMRLASQPRLPGWSLWCLVDANLGDAWEGLSQALPETGSHLRRTLTTACAPWMQGLLDLRGLYQRKSQCQ